MLKAKINEEFFNGLSDELKKEYTKQSDGSYVLSVEAVSGFSLEDVSGLKATLSEVKEDKRKLRSQLDAFGDLDPEKAKNALDKLEKIGDPEKMSTDEKVHERLNSMKQQMEEKHDKIVKELGDKIRLRESQLTKMLIDAEAVKAISANKGNANILIPAIKERVEVREKEGGEYEVFVKDENGNPRISAKQGSTDPMSITELVESMKNGDFACAFEGTGASGSGSKNGQTVTNGIKNPWSKDSRNLTEQCRIAKENPELAKQLEAQAT